MHFFAELVNGVYPRVCGGSGTPMRFVLPAAGLSPRVRGKLLLIPTAPL